MKDVNGERRMYKRTATIVAWHKPGLALNSGIFDVALNEKRDRVYVNGFRTPSVMVIDGKTTTYLKQIMFKSDPFMWPGFSAIHYSPLTDRIYNVSEALKSLFVLDAEEEKMIKAIELPKAARGIKVDPKTGLIFLTHYGEGTYTSPTIVSLRIPDEMYQKEQYFHHVSVLDRNEELVKTIEVDWRPWELCIDAERARTYVSCKGKDWNRQGTLCVIDNKDLEMINRIKVGRKPRGVAVNHKHHKIYVACRYDNLVYVIDTKEDEVVGKIPVDTDCIGVVANPFG